MTVEEFGERLAAALPPGAVRPNLGKGTTTIKGYRRGQVIYQRANSRFSVACADLLDSYQRFQGQRVSCNDLRDYRPHIFDNRARPSGHSCHATFLLIALLELGLAEDLQGSGKPKNPFSVQFLPSP